jgi:adducin
MNPSLNLHGLGEWPIVPIADLEGSTKYSAEEIQCRNKLAALFRLVDMFQWSQGIYNHITLSLPNKTGDPMKQEVLINPLGMLYREITASSFVKITLDGQVLDPGSTPLGINQAGYILHSAIHEAREDGKCALHVHTAAGSAVSTMKCGLLPLNQEAMLIGPVSYHQYEGMLSDEQEKESIKKSLGSENKVIILHNHGFAVAAETVEEALHLTYHTIIALETQVRAVRGGIENLIMPSKQAVKRAYEIAKHGSNGMNRTVAANGKMQHTYEKVANIEWGVGELEWEAYMRTLDEAGYQTGHHYRLPSLRKTIYSKMHADSKCPSMAQKHGK